jgi:integrase/recombinase XerD
MRLVARAGWITGDPAAGLSHRHLGRPAPPLSGEQVAAVFRLPVSLREHALWRLLHDSGAPAASVLGLDADQLDLARNRVRARDSEPSLPGAIEWRAETSRLVRWLLAGRTQGPAFLTGRRAPAATAPADTCRATGQGRLSYRRAAELFTGLTRPLDDAGRGWTLHQLGAGGGQRARLA